ncbi:hypothetical protein [Dyadobacter sp. CY326]|uniref:hypothetical protein n=1 Tax=Dyadobacter sp. CY326 TaxID=2907300 RepID=UPI001F2E485F|nr:hypothetical protein [Dyadobacter sp. CY326]MCE7066663.1 hypothetical protein [Dyadobacter sp. CY326]
MTSFRNVQNALDRILGGGAMPNHGAFWRDIDRDKFVELTVYGLKLVVIGQPAESNLIKSLRALAPFGSDATPPTPGSYFPRMPKNRPPATEEDLILIESWIEEGCPPGDAGDEHSFLVSEIKRNEDPDEKHVRYWQAVDDFFLPIPQCMTSDETKIHVNRMHALAFQFWIQQVFPEGDESAWPNYMHNTDNLDSFKYVRQHQRRLIQKFYGNSQDEIFESFWKFGANLLPEDPSSCARSKHTMNSVDDWFYWAPHLDATLTATDSSPVDLAMARAWQIGLIADGLLRKDADRPLEMRMPIPDFAENEPDLKERVMRMWGNAGAADLQKKMKERAAQFFLRGNV